MSMRKKISIIGVIIFCVVFNHYYFVPYANPFYKLMVIAPLAICVYGVINFLFKFKEILKGEKDYSRQIEKNRKKI